MKRFYLKLSISFCVLFFITTSLTAQTPELWGMTHSGGTDNIGVIFKTDINGNNQNVQHHFTKENSGREPENTQLCEATNGKLYGMTCFGGAYNLGVLFEYDPMTNIYIKKLNFDGSDKGANPYGSLILAQNGKLYGMSAYGGPFDEGVLFEYDPITNTYTKKINFDGSDKGARPEGSLMQAQNGKLYGMTAKGGASGDGVLFEYDTATNTYTKKIDFDATAKGASPQGSLIQAQNGKLYGMTVEGGTSDYGVIFEYDLAINTYTKKIDFDGIDKGAAPQGSLMQAQNGKLYGMTEEGGTNDYGVLFEYDIDTNTYTKKINFNDVGNGAYPSESLMQAQNGKLYGMTSYGGILDRGVLFEYDTDTNTIAKKVDFFGSVKGEEPLGTLMQAQNGKLYGMTSRGGETNGVRKNNGVLFEYVIETDTYTKKIDFDGVGNGLNPYGSLMQAQNGKLYGMTSAGGAFGDGILFEFNTITNTKTIKIDFDDVITGRFALGSLMQAQNMKLYGMTLSGGTSNGGVLFEYDPDTNTYTKKLDFVGASNGLNPGGSLIQAQNGKLYGMTVAGGTSNGGVIFEYDIDTNTYTKKLDFDGVSNGLNPTGSLMQAQNGKLYGMTSRGGTFDFGVLFEFDIDTNTFTKLLDFDRAATGENPKGDLIQAQNGKLYGLTEDGGTSNRGVLFEYDPNTNTYNKKLDFDGNNTFNGISPSGSLMQASNGKLYGMTKSGGTSGFGVLFEYDPAANTYTKKLDLEFINGSNPYYTNLIEITGEGLLVDQHAINTIMLYPNPANKGYFNLNIPAGIDILEVSVYNTLGSRLFYKKNIKPGSNTTISTQFAHSIGLYLVKLKSKGFTVVKKLIIN